MTPEQRYLQKSSEETRKKYGQFFTPKIISDIMAKWILRDNPKTILEPSIGTGIFVRSINSYKKTKCHIDGFDIDSGVLEIIKESKQDNLTIHNADFLTYDIKESYDAAISNPPYIRHHSLSYDTSIHNEIGNLCGVSVSKMANAYVLFVMKVCHHLKTGGRAAFIIPSEWSNSDFGRSLKEYLINHIGLDAVIYFSNCESLFDHALTTSNILLVNKGHRKDHVRVAYIESSDQFNYDDVDTLLENAGQDYSADQLISSDKWNSLFKNGVLSHENMVPLSEFGMSKRGIATGANNFFLVNKETANHMSPSNLKRCVGKAADIKTTIFTDEDYEALSNSGKRCVLFDAGKRLNNYETNYLASGALEGLTERYILARRKPWYKMEKRPVAPILVTVFSRGKVRFIYNEARVYNLTAFHGFYPEELSENQIKALVCCLNSPIISQHIEAQCRVYGGGLIKLEPKDILKIMVPNIKKFSSHSIEFLANSLGENVPSDQIDSIISEELSR